MNRRFKLLTIVATIAMTMFGTKVCRAEASAKTNVENECCSAEKDDDNKVDIYFKDGKKNSIIVMVNGEKNQTVLIVFSGTFSTSSIAKIFQETK